MIEQIEFGATGAPEPDPDQLEAALTAGAVNDVMVEGKPDAAANDENDENAPSDGRDVADSSGKNVRDISV